MSERLKQYCRDNANQAIGRLEESHKNNLSEAARSRRSLKYGGVILAASGVITIVEKTTGLVPHKFDSSTYVALGFGALYAISGYIGNRLDKGSAASNAKVAIGYAVPNEITLPDWVEPYVEENSEMIERLNSELVERAE